MMLAGPLGDEADVAVGAAGGDDQVLVERFFVPVGADDVAAAGGAEAGVPADVGGHDKILRRR